MHAAAGAPKGPDTAEVAKERQVAGGCAFHCGTDAEAGSAFKRAPAARGGEMEWWNSHSRGRLCHMFPASCYNRNMDDPVRWYAVWTRARHEFSVREDLCAKGMEVFLPTMQRDSTRRDRHKTLTAPLFPGYVFVHSALNKMRYLQVARTLGVVTVLGWQEKNPLWIPDEQIESVKILVDRSLPLSQHPYLRKGQWVRVVSGPLKEVVGIIQSVKGRQRLIVQIEMLKRAVSCEFSAGDVMPINAP